MTGFVRRECARRGVASAKATVTGLRSLLRFLYLDGQVSAPLTGAVPSAACWQLAALPRAVSPAELARLMDSCDRDSVAGRRDFAILVLLARLGLRARGGRRPGPWRHQLAAGRDHRARQGQPARHPAVARRRGRGDGRLARRGPPARRRLPGGVRAAAPAAWPARLHQRVACRPPGLGKSRCYPGRGAPAAALRRGRHARGGTLAEIGQVLRHAQPGTTAIYAKTDVLALSPLARPWPGGSR